MSIKEFIANAKETRKQRATIAKRLRASYEATRYYNIDFDKSGLAYITFQSERITTASDPQDMMLLRLRTLRQMYIENQLNS